MHEPTVLSTFSGVGGLDLGLARAGWRHFGLCESEPYRRAVLAERFPGVPIAEDVREVATGGGGRPLAGVVGGVWAGADGGRGGTRAEDGDDRVDLLCGGFPCQDLSVAGRRRGLAGERSGLFFEFARIAESVRPRALLIENVPGLLSSHGGRDFGELLGTLAELGYGVAWRILDSRHFGVPQRRRRVFIVGVDAGGRAGAERAGEILALGASCERHPPAGREAGAGASGGIADGAGDARPLTTGTGQRYDAETDDMVVSTLQAPKGRGWRTDAEMAAGGHLVPVGFHLTQDPISLEGASLPLGHKSTGNGVHSGASVRRLTPRECERLQGFPETGKTVRMVVWRSPENTRSPALADALSRSEPASVWTADGDGSWRRAGSAEQSSSTHRLGLGLPVVARALIDSEREAVQLRSHDGWSEPARSAGESISSRHPWPSGDFARAIVLMQRELASAIPAGRAASPAFSVPSGLHPSGEWLVHLSGDVIDAFASDAALCMSEASRCMKFITSVASPSSPSCGSTWTTLFSCVAAAICGSTPVGIPSASSFACEVTSTSGWTLIDWRGRPAADSLRYAALGDAVTVPVAEWLGERLLCLSSAGS